jgi:hypothetical protein
MLSTFSLSRQRLFSTACCRYPSKKRASIYQAIREEWRENKDIQQKDKLDKQIAVAYKGLQQLRQFDEQVMSGGVVDSPNWSVSLEQNPMPKPAHLEGESTQK